MSELLESAIDRLVRIARVLNAAISEPSQDEWSELAFALGEYDQVVDEERESMAGLCERCVNREARSPHDLFCERCERELMGDDLASERAAREQAERERDEARAQIAALSSHHALKLYEVGAAKDKAFDTLRAELAATWDALAVYAEPDNWQQLQWDDHLPDCAMFLGAEDDRDAGKLARDALAVRRPAGGEG